MVYVLTKAYPVWNRSFSDDPGTGVGDRHLRAMAKPYGRIMSDGVSTVMDTSTAEEVQRAGDAFEYLGLADLADLTRRLADADWSDDNLDERPMNNAFWGWSSHWTARLSASAPSHRRTSTPSWTTASIDGRGRGHRVVRAKRSVHVN